MGEGESVSGDESPIHDLANRTTGDRTYKARVERYEYVLKRMSQTPKPTVQAVADELGISKQNVSRLIVRGTVRPSGRQPTNAGQIARMETRLARWKARRDRKAASSQDTEVESRWIDDLEAQLASLGVSPNTPMPPTQHAAIDEKGGPEAPLVPKTMVNRRSDVDAKDAFVESLGERGFAARVTSVPADITATRGGSTYYFEIKFTNQRDSYFGAATLTEWEAAMTNPGQYWFVTAQRTDAGWVFHEYTPQEFMAFSTIPPFKVFFQIPVGPGRASAPSTRISRSVPLTEARLQQMADLFHSWAPAPDPNSAT